MNRHQKQIKDIVNGAERILIIQADNPDADSLGSSLALEHMLGDIGKQPLMYCGIDIPAYLRHLPGWDRVSNELPAKFDASIIVDASTLTLLQKLQEAGGQGSIAAKPVIVLDHHEGVQNRIDFAAVTINDPTVSSTGELIYDLAKALDWPVSLPAMEAITTAVLGDTQGLSNQLATPRTYRLIADFIEAGVNRPKLEELRRAHSKMPVNIFRYKARLIERVDFDTEGIAHVLVPQAEINEFSPLYNPAALIQADMLQTEAVGVAIVFKHYDDGRITASIRCNPGYPIAARLAEAFNGGGHAYASGFKITDGRSFQDIKSECVATAASLLAEIKESEHAVA